MILMLYTSFHIDLNLMTKNKGKFAGHHIVINEKSYISWVDYVVIEEIVGFV